MTKINDKLQYSESHEWVKVEDNLATIGISDHAQSLLGDLVYIELPELQSEITLGKEIAVVESVKAASDVYAPISGKVIAVNDALTQTPALMNEDPYDKGWLCQLELNNPEELKGLLDAKAYHDAIGE
mgnify:CR=1 FL=1